MNIPTEEDFKSVILNRMRGSHIRTWEIIDTTWEIRFYLEQALGAVEAARTLNKWLNEILIPEYPEAKDQKYGHWRLRGTKEAESIGGIFKPMSASRSNIQTEERRIR